jgi:hypothetical protein
MLLLWRLFGVGMKYRWEEEIVEGEDREFISIF